MFLRSSLLWHSRLKARKVARGAFRARVHPFWPAWLCHKGNLLNSCSRVSRTQESTSSGPTAGTRRRLSNLGRPQTKKIRNQGSLDLQEILAGPSVMEKMGSYCRLLRKKALCVGCLRWWNLHPTPYWVPHGMARGNWPFRSWPMGIGPAKARHVYALPGHDQTETSWDPSKATGGKSTCVGSEKTPSGVAWRFERPFKEGPFVAAGEGPGWAGRPYHPADGGCEVGGGRKICEEADPNSRWKRPSSAFRGRFVTS